MTKAELIDAVVKKTEMTKKDAGRAIDAIFETIKEELSKGEKVQLVEEIRGPWRRSEFLLEMYLRSDQGKI